MKKGFSTLFLVIILGEIGLTLMLWISAGSFWLIKSSLNNENVTKARMTANACAEVALDLIMENNDLVGSGNKTIDSNTCNYSISNTGGNTRKIVASGMVKNITKNIEITTSSLNPITVSSWKEI